MLDFVTKKSFGFRHVSCIPFPMETMNTTLKATLMSVVLLSAFTFGKKAHSAPHCSDFLQPALSQAHEKTNASVAGFKLQDLITDHMLSSTFSDKTFSLFTEIYLSPFLFKKALLKISIEEDKSISIAIVPEKTKHLKYAQEKLSKLQEELFFVFNHSRTSGELTPIKTSRDPMSSRLFVSISFQRGVSDKKIKMAAYIARKLLKLESPPVLPYWELPLAEPLRNHSLYHIPEHLKAHSPPKDLAGQINHKVSSYAIPKNLPEDLYSYFRDSHSYKFILSSSLWNVESVYKTPEGELKTLSLEITPEGALLVDFSPYAARPPLKSSDYLYQEVIDRIKSEDFTSVTHSPQGGYLRKLHVEIDRLLDFFKELKDARYELQPPENRFLSPAGVPTDNLSRFRP